MKTNIGLNDEARSEVGQILNFILADEYVLYVTTRDYRWNVTGPEFLGLHQQFGEQSGLLAQWIDDVAERVRAIGVGARGNGTDLVQAARTSADTGIDMPPAHMVASLLALHEAMIVQLRTDRESCVGRLKDAGTADFLASLLRQHEKAAWMLRAQIENQRGGGIVMPVWAARRSHRQ
ncbi:MAG: DNA starvation/stationary phase protection protein [Opitutaceae bacterium]|nr:DNA starvation/stationary phase protection protein [Opitutaceae bacterium]